MAATATMFEWKIRETLSIKTIQNKITSNSSAELLQISDQFIIYDHGLYFSLEKNAKQEIIFKIDLKGFQKQIQKVSFDLILEFIEGNKFRAYTNQSFDLNADGLTCLEFKIYQYRQFVNNDQFTFNINLLLQRMIIAIISPFPQINHLKIK